MDKVKFGIIGCGRIAQRHSKHISKYGILISVCDIVSSKAKKLAKDYSANAESYAGKVLDVRNIEDQPLAWETLMYGKCHERSQNLVTVELEDGETKAFYDGRMIGLNVA